MCAAECVAKNGQTNGTDRNYRISRPIRRTVIFLLEILEKKKMEFNFINLLEEKKIVTCQN
jgi:hypothetical protein